LYGRPVLATLCSRHLTHIKLFCHHNIALALSLVLFCIYIKLFKIARRFKVIYTLVVAGRLLLSGVWKTVHPTLLFILSYKIV